MNRKPLRETGFQMVNIFSEHAQWSQFLVFTSPITRGLKDP